MLKKIVIIGAGGHAREVLDIIEACNQAGTVEYEPLGFIVESPYGSPGTIINGKPILGDFDWLAGRSNQLYAICGVGMPDLRWHLVRKAQQHGIRFESIIHPSTITTPRITLGEGVVIAPGCVFTNQIQLGHHVHINVGCTISHDTIIEDFVTVSPGAHLAGYAHLETGCFIGLGAKVVDRKRVGEWSIVGAGCTVIQNVPSNSTVVGVPGKVIKTRPANWQLTQI